MIWRWPVRDAVHRLRPRLAKREAAATLGGRARQSIEAASGTLIRLSAEWRFLVYNYKEKTFARKENGPTGAALLLSDPLGYGW
jgi:hypothetical protein